MTDDPDRLLRHGESLFKRARDFGWTDDGGEGPLEFLIRRTYEIAFEDAGRGPVRVIYYVSAYDEGGYGDNRSQEFTSGEAAVKYAESLEARFHPVVLKRIISMEQLSTQIWPEEGS